MRSEGGQHTKADETSSGRGHATPLLARATPLLAHATPLLTYATPLWVHATPENRHATPRKIGFLFCASLGWVAIHAFVLLAWGEYLSAYFMGGFVHVLQSDVDADKSSNLYLKKLESL